MPSTSKKQHNFMAAIAHNPGFAKKVGVPQSVGKDFSDADKVKKFGGSGRADRQVINKKKTDQGSMDLFKGGGMATSAKMKMQKDMNKEFPQGISKKGAMPKQQEMGMMGMKKGGMAACAPMKKGNMPKKMAGGGMHKMPDGKMMKDSAMKKMNMGGMAKGGGIESKGKTKGTMIKMSKGGKYC